MSIYSSDFRDLTAEVKGLGKAIVTAAKINAEGRVEAAKIEAEGRLAAAKVPQRQVQLPRHAARLP